MESGLPHFAVIYPDNISNPHGCQTWFCRENYAPLYYCNLTLSVKNNYIYWFKKISLDSTDSDIILFIIIFYMLY